MPELHRSLIDIASTLNRPENDAALLQKAGLALERALFPLLVLVERLGPIGVVDLAGRVGRDHTTVSRQVARLEELGLVERRAGKVDRRVREAVITPKGKIATDALDAARGRMALELFEGWSQADFDDLVRLMRKFADGMGTVTEGNGL
ncbi:MarR family winged helix-turn-helix transcriptional regulator [Caulobacter sp.]|uniref:MarR family winged helix-turn-helix transcriptional regulator n=1 Tax=Caulobacter sp. TaxID=78 RepID=UPI003BAE30FA